MIKTTPKKIMEGMPGLNALLQAKLPVKAKYSVSKLGRACQEELETFEKTREKIFTDAGCVKGETKWTHPDGPDAVQTATKEVDELAGVEVEINALPLDLEQFGNGDIEGPAFYGLDWAMKAD